MLCKNIFVKSKSEIAALIFIASFKKIQQFVRELAGYYLNNLVTPVGYFHGILSPNETPGCAACKRRRKARQY